MLHICAQLFLGLSQKQCVETKRQFSEDYTKHEAYFSDKYVFTVFEVIKELGVLPNVPDSESLL